MDQILASHTRSLDETLDVIKDVARGALPRRSAALDDREGEPRPLREPTGVMRCYRSGRAVSPRRAESPLWEQRVEREFLGTRARAHTASIVHKLAAYV